MSARVSGGVSLSRHDLYPKFDLVAGMDDDPNGACQICITFDSTITWNANGF